MSLPATPRGSWISKELERLYGANKWKSGKGVDLNGNGRLEKNEKIATFNSNTIPSNDKSVVGDWTDWLAFYRANYRAIHRKAAGSKNSVFFWAANFKAKNPIHIITSIESPLVKRQQVLTAYKKTWNIIARASKIPVKGRSKLKLAKAKLLAVYTAMAKSGIKFKNQDHKNPLLVENMARGVLDCDTASFVIFTKAHEKGWPLFGVHAPEHFFIRWDNKRTRVRFNIDVNSKKRFPTDKEYKEAFNISPRAISAGVYLKNLKLSSLVSMIFTNRGQRYNSLGKNQEAIKDYTKAIKLDPNFIDAYYNRGTTYKKLNKHTLAIKDYTKAIKLDPKLARAYNNRGVAYNALGKHALAIKDYTKAIVLNPKFAGAYNNRGVAYDALGKHTLAIRDYTKAIKVNRKYAMAYYNLGAVYANLGKYKLAVKAFTEAIKVNRKYAVAYYGRGVTHLRTKQYTAAIGDFRKLLSLMQKSDPAYIQVRDKLEKAYFNRGIRRVKVKKFSGAISDFREVLKLNSKNSLALFHIKKYTPCIRNPRRCP